MSPGVNGIRSPVRPGNGCAPIRTLAALFLGSMLVLHPGCSGALPEFEPGEIRAFQVPVGGSGSGTGSTPVLFTVPAGYRTDREWPVLVAVHGYGSSAARFHDLWRRPAMDAGFILVTPQGEVRTSEGIGWSWGPRGEEVIRRSIDHAMAILRAERSRICVAGFSQGGELAHRLGLGHPNVFHGIALLGTPFRDNSPVPGEGASPAGLRVYIGRGELEPEPGAARAAAATLEAIGCTVRRVEYPGIGHALPDPIEAELGRILAFLGAGGGVD